VSYCQQGKLAYEIASEIEDEEDQEAPSDLLHRLSAQFDLCAYGLREVRRQWEEGPAEGSGPILL
jgi:stalled ribosome rescue protein Dom34